MAEEKKEEILKVLKQFPNDKLSVTQLQQQMIKKISYPTLLKWVQVLQAEKKIRIDDYGNIKLVYLNTEYFENQDGE